MGGLGFIHGFSICLPFATMALTNKIEILEVPPEEKREMDEIRDELMIAAYFAIQSIKGPLEAESRVAAERMREAGYSRSVIRSEIKRIGALRETLLVRAMREQIQRGLEAGKRYALIAANAARKLASKVRARPTQGRLDAERAIARKSPGDKLAKSLIKKPKRKLSASIHGEQAAANREIYREIRKAAKNSRSITDAARKLAKSLQKAGAPVPKLSLYMDNLKKAGVALARSAGPAEQEAWRRALAGARRYADNLADSGVMRRGLLKSLEKMERMGPDALDSAVKRWVGDKQIYNAERIIRTEQQLAFKDAQIEADAEDPRIIGYIWKMNRGAGRKKRVIRTRGRRSGKRGKGSRFGCICETLDGQQISVETARARPIGHPNCMCSLIPVYGPAHLTK